MLTVFEPWNPTIGAYVHRLEPILLRTTASGDSANALMVNPAKNTHKKPGSSLARPKESAATPSRLSEQVYESLVELIVRGRLQPTQPVSELELARMLSVSRTPIHEAVKQLVKDGLVVQAANRRPVVVSFGPDDIFDVYEMRIILESEAAAKAAERMDRPTLSKLETSMKEFCRNKRSMSSISGWVVVDDEFHSAIARASGSPRLSADIDRYRLLHRVFNRTHNDASVLQQAVDEHQCILDALKRRQPEEARKAMRIHLEEWQRFFAKHLR